MLTVIVTIGILAIAGMYAVDQYLSRKYSK